MNIVSLRMCLNSVSNNSSKVDLLKNMIDQVTDFSWDIISQVIDTISNNSYKVKAIEVIVNSKVRKNFTVENYVRMTNTQICNVITSIDNNSYKKEAFAKLNHYLGTSTGTDLCNIIRSVSNGSYQKDIVLIWVTGSNSRSITFDQLYFLINLIDNNSYKSETISAICEHPNCIVSGNISQLTTILGNISNNSYALAVFNVLLDVMVKQTENFKFTVDDILSIFNKISNNSYRLDALRSIKAHNLLYNIKSTEIIKLIKVVTSSQTDLVEIIKDNCDNNDIFNNAESLCEELSVLLQNKNSFHKVCVTLHLSEEIYKPYEDKLPDNDILFENVINGNVFGNLNSCVYGTSTQIIQIGNKKTTIIKNGNSIMTTVEYV